jgi:hypothetical protein
MSKWAHNQYEQKLFKKGVIYLKIKAKQLGQFLAAEMFLHLKLSLLRD